MYIFTSQNPTENNQQFHMPEKISMVGTFGLWEWVEEEKF